MNETTDASLNRSIEKKVTVKNGVDKAKDEEFYKRKKVSRQEAR